MDKNSYRKIACPSCGASLLVDPGAKTTRCTFCGLVIQWPKTKAPPPSEPEIKLSIPKDRGTSRAGSHPAPRAFLFTALSLSLCLIVGIGLLVWIVTGLGSPNSILKSPLSLTGPAALLEADPASPPDVIAFGFEVSADNYQLARLSPAGHKAVWRGKTFQDISDVSEIVALGDRFFTAEGAAVHAYAVKDGSALWQAGLPDKLGYCKECLSARGDRVVVLTRDYTLQALDAATGEIAWTRRLAEYTTDFWTLGDMVLVIDKEGSEEYSLLELNLSNGNVYRQITPECKSGENSMSERLDNVSTVVPDPNSAGSIYVFYGYYPACLERWDLAEGKLLWQTVDDKGYSPSNDYSMLMTADTLYFAADNSLWATETETGKTRLVTQMTDYEPVPLAQAGEQLIVRVKRTRGTTKFGLWGMDPAQGEKIWQRMFDTGVPLDPPDKAGGLVDKDQSAWTFRMGDGQLAVLEFQAQPNRLMISTLDTQNGNAASEKPVPLKMKDDYFVPTILGWRGNVLWVIVDSGVYGIDIGAGKIAYSYP